MRVLLTGFEPFGGHAVNPSQMVVERFRDGTASVPAAIELRTLVLPVVGERAPRMLVEAARAFTPEFVLSLGQGRRRAGLAIERLTVNLREYRLTDNVGSLHDRGAIVPGGPDGLFTTLPNEALLAALLQAGVPAELSLEPSTFVCNEVCYRLLHAITSDRDSQMGSVRAGFVHIPMLPAQAATVAAPPPSIDLATLTRAVEAMLAALVASAPGRPPDVR